jgi:hypothetical protein
MSTLDPSTPLFTTHGSGLTDAPLRRALAENPGVPVLYVEGDRVPPAAKNIAKALAAAEKRGAEFALASHGLTGIYSPDTRWLIPRTTPAGGLRPWIEHHLGPLVVAAPSLDTTKRAPAVMKPGGRPVFRHPGDLGDIIAALPIIRQLGGGDLVISNHANPAWRPMEGARYKSLLPLLLTCPYLSSVSFDRDGRDRATHDLGDFRREFYKPTQTLTRSQADSIGVADVDVSPWLGAGIVASEESAGRIVVNRTERYGNDMFPFYPLAKKHARRMLFVGLPEEHAIFEKRLEVRVEYRPTSNFLEVAELIAGSALFIGNQSSACWIAMALGHALVQETNATIQDSIVPRPNAQFCTGGAIRPVPGLPFQFP